MASNEVQIAIHAKPTLSLLWIKTMRWAAYVLGPDRAIDWAQRGALRLMLIRFDNGPWRFLRP